MEKITTTRDDNIKNQNEEIKDKEKNGMPKEDTIRKHKTICEVDEDDGMYGKKICGSYVEEETRM